MNSIKYYALRDGINPRKAQRYREKLQIGKWIGGKTGSWVVNDQEWEKIKESIPSPPRQ